MSTLTADRQPPRIAVEIVRLLVEALVESHKTASRGSKNRENSVFVRRPREARNEPQ